MPRASVVIGAHFGDEAKGLLTDYYAAQSGPGTVVARFNGGAQAGHTVVAPDGRRHVFSHVGAGSLAGAATYLSRFFMANPMVLLRELASLRAMGVVPRISLDPACLVTTPWDVLINEMAESARGAARHGSVGLGINETVVRSETAHAIRVADLADPASLLPRLDRIRREWVPARLAALGFPGLERGRANLLLSDGLLQHWVADAQAMLAAVRVEGIAVLRRAPALVFEGAQGLLLDQNLHAPWFPHLTRSNTGIANAAALAAEAGLTGLDITYATRSYLTRHGAGPLPGELPDRPFAGIDDPTNQPHRFQGTLRFALLDLDLLRRSIHADLARLPTGLDVGLQLAVSCLDQVGTDGAWLSAGTIQRGSPQALAQAAQAAVGFPGLLTSWGPSRTTICRDGGASRRAA